MPIADLPPTAMSHSGNESIWYRQPMVWLVIGIPLSSVIMGVVLIVLAVRTSDGLVADDYYKRGLEINRVLARDARAHELELAADIEISRGDNRVTASLSGTSVFEGPAELRLGFYHATRAGEDQVLTLRRDARGVHTAPAPALSEGRWHVIAETAEWRLTRVIHLPRDGGFSLAHREPPRTAQGADR